MVVHVTVEKPCAWAVGFHIGHHHAHGPQIERIGAHIAKQNGLTVPMWRMDVIFVAVCHQIPANMLALLHRQQRQRASNKTVQRLIFERLTEIWIRDDRG